MKTHLVIETEATQNKINEFHSKSNGGKVEWLSKAYWLSNQEKQAIMEVDVDETFPKYTIPSNLLPFDDGFDSEDINKRYPDY